MIEKKSWEEFRDCKMLWWVNRIIHTFGWSIIVEMGENGKIINTYPAKVSFRGFNHFTEEEGYRGITQHLFENIEELKEETK